MRTRIYFGRRDDIIDARSSRVAKIIRNLKARVVWIEDADHDSIVRRVTDGDVAVQALWLPAHR